MAFAPHTNEDAHLPLLLGCFTEKEYGNLFEYAERPADDRGGWMIEEFPHLVYVGGHGIGDRTRVARVLKTVAHVVTDEDAREDAVVQVWGIKQHRVYDLRGARS